ncbi:MAG TPA: RNA polymerase sigma factor [Rugosimonospora sp.]|nr:RNA polymerase sigma factor [Rugosimonospora sp.]
MAAVARRRELAQSGWDAEDIVQDVLILAAAWWTRVDDAHRRAWLRTVALNQVRRAQRTEIRQRLHGALAPPRWSSSAAAQDLEHAVPVRLAANEAVDAIAELPLGQRAITYLHKVEGYSRPEIAAILGISENTVGTQLTRSTMRLRQRLDHWAEVAKALALATLVGAGGYLAARVLGRLDLRLPHLPIDSRVQDLLAALISSAATLYRALLAQAGRTVWIWFDRRRRRALQRARFDSDPQTPERALRRRPSGRRRPVRRARSRIRAAQRRYWD